jgi:hypothetical protein
VKLGQCVLVSNTTYPLMNYSATPALRFPAGTSGLTAKHDNVFLLHKSNTVNVPTILEILKILLLCSHLKRTWRRYCWRNSQTFTRVFSFNISNECGFILQTLAIILPYKIKSRGVKIGGRAGHKLRLTKLLLRLFFPISARRSLAGFLSGIVA